MSSGQEQIRPEVPVFFGLVPPSTRIRAASRNHEGTFATYKRHYLGARCTWSAYRFTGALPHRSDSAGTLVGAGHRPAGTDGSAS